MQNRVKEMREEAGYSRERMARILAVHQNTVQNWEGGGEIKSTNLIQLAALFDTTAEHLMCLDEPEPEAAGDAA